MPFDIEEFMSTGSFFPGLSNQEAVSILDNSKNDVFGESVVMYYYYFQGYSVTFSYNRDSATLIGQQVEILDASQLTATSCLSRIVSVTHFQKAFSSEIEAAYSDEDEVVVFLRSGVNVYFIDKRLSKITSPDALSRKFVETNFDEA